MSFFLADLLKVALKNESMQVETVPDGEKALEVVENISYDLKYEQELHVVSATWMNCSN